MQPMLASPAKELTFPLYASPKIDGVRAYVQNGVLLSRSAKPIRNAYTQATYGKGVLNGLDGELCVGAPYAKDLMQKTTSGVMSEDGEPDVCWYVFDVWSWPDLPFEQRMRSLNYGSARYVRELHEQKRLVFLQQKLILTADDLVGFEHQCLAQGYEGVMVRSPSGRYKYGRSTAREGYLLKVKRWADGEARIVDLKEFMHNGNELEQDNFGYAKRSSHQAGKVPMNMLGAFVCEDLKTGQPITIGTGFTMEQRKDFWNRRKEFQGVVVKYKHFAQTGVKDASRFPVFLGFRHPEDMS